MSFLFKNKKELITALFIFSVTIGSCQNTERVKGWQSDRDPVLDSLIKIK